jgi:hypothetical protein
MTLITAMNMCALAALWPAAERGEKDDVDYRDEYVCISGFTSTKVQILTQKEARQEREMTLSTAMNMCASATGQYLHFCTRKTCCTGTKVRILTLMSAMNSCASAAAT